MTKKEITKKWKAYQKIGFRFAFICFLLFILLMDWSVNPILSQLYYYGPLSTLLDNLVTWVGQDLLGISDIIISPYDGEHNDRTYVYLLYTIITVIAVIGSFVWSLVDKKRQNYQQAYYWLTAIIRYYLAFTMFLFALEKFFKTQFPDLGYYTLTERVGDMSPMHLAWAFFGYSYTYNIFMGLAESAALLLLFRRTTTLGALLTMATLSNVIVVNYNFDVHAKMYPTALFLMAFFLILRDVKRIVEFFTSQKPVSLPAIKAPKFKQRWMSKAKIILKCAVIGYFMIYLIYDYTNYNKSINEDTSMKAKYLGIYDVNSFVINNDTLSMSDPARWNQIIIGDQLLEAIRFQEDSLAYIKTLAEKNEIIVYGDPIELAVKMQEIYNEKGLSDTTWMQMDSILVNRQIAGRFRFEIINDSIVHLEGSIKNDSIYLVAKRNGKAINSFRLMKRRFHWINETSYFY